MAPEAAGASRSGQEPARRRHVWVDVSGGYSYPGLVLGWRRTGAGGWEAQTAVVHNRSVLVQWTPADHLHPIADHRPSSTPDQQ